MRKALVENRVWETPLEGSPKTALTTTDRCFSSDAAAAAPAAPPLLHFSVGVSEGGGAAGEAACCTVEIVCLDASDRVEFWR